MYGDAATLHVISLYAERHRAVKRLAATPDSPPPPPVKASSQSQLCVPDSSSALVWVQSSLALNFALHSSDFRSQLMKMQACLSAALLLCYVLLCSASERHKSADGGIQSSGRKTERTLEVRRNDTSEHDRTATPKLSTKTARRKKAFMGARHDTSCTRLGGICQATRFICQGRYLSDKCGGGKMRRCCLPVGAWSVLCAGHHNNRVRACDAHGCGAFNSGGGDGLHKAVDLVCDDYGVVNAPFSGALAGPVSHKHHMGVQYDGVKLISDEHCVKIFNVRPLRYMGPVVQGEPLGYVLPLQDRVSGITSHLELQMCDGSDPSPFI
ncbi:uncharacterized protein ACB058_016423 [Synchiropus picturatus]